MSNLKHSSTRATNQINKESNDQKKHMPRPPQSGFSYPQMGFCNPRIGGNGKGGKAFLIMVRLRPMCPDIDVLGQKDALGLSAVALSDVSGVEGLRRASLSSVVFVLQYFQNNHILIEQVYHESYPDGNHRYTGHRGWIYHHQKSTIPAWDAGACLYLPLDRGTGYAARFGRGSFQFD